MARYHLAVTDSTNDEALRRAAEGTGTPPFWITAERQTGGKGRRGRQWVSEPGNLFASLAYPVAGLPSETGRLPLVAAVAVREALANLVGARSPVAIKWPNDVLVGGRKLCGILIEQHVIAATELVVIGIGVNIGSRPEIARYPTACLAEIGVDASPEDVWRALAQSFCDWFAVWRGRDGFAAIREEWLAQAAGLGETIIVAGEKSSRTGIFAALDDNGCLILHTDDGGAETISSGDVILKMSER